MLQFENNSLPRTPRAGRKWAWTEGSGTGAQRPGTWSRLCHRLRKKAYVCKKRARKLSNTKG